MSDGFWVVRDSDDVVHRALSRSYPVLLGHNNIDYEDYDETFCERAVTDGWTSDPSAPITCVRCAATYAALMATAYTYLETKTGRASCQKSNLDL